ncbi:8670_t:CDS:1, partial [Diversispora eburnea]
CENVTMSSYQIGAKTELPIIYLRDQKPNLWNKFTETCSNSMKRSTFMGLLKNSTNLKYHDDLGGLCQILW